MHGKGKRFFSTSKGPDRVRGLHSILINGNRRLYHWGQSERSVKLTMIAAITPLTHIPSGCEERKIYFNLPYNKAGGTQRLVQHTCSGSYLDTISGSGITPLLI